MSVVVVKAGRHLWTGIKTLKRHGAPVQVTTNGLRCSKIRHSAALVDRRHLMALNLAAIAARVLIRDKLRVD